MEHPTHNPWKITGQKEIYDNKWINVTEYQVINPSGNPGIYGKIHYKNRAIGVIALDEELNIYLVGQYRFVLDQYTWEIPEGGGPLGTEPLDGAKRELLEETGLIAKKWTKIQDFHLSNSVNDEFGHIFLAQDLEQHEAEPEDTEELIVKKVPFEQAYQMVLNNEITDSLSVAGILRVKIMLLEKTLP
ncbi:NUDIX hydrolase [Mucilaginibacter sp. RS28]|uniref:GDP-mannose pyrophosphatase n=1 Tax=Mucilaginibacter straminoryzae TaxID=2932774 RepID=A0A9X1X5G5_9SPHI|nr:NUDIX hydrolase [Mucilaginibacter straminoryzae]MCJ8210785.1 NUDIX hydrolase [Mucilaginibacter straminoryzae]